MKEVDAKQKDMTISIDFDGVIHRYSKGFQGLDNAYDEPFPGTRRALEALKSKGYRLLICSCRPSNVIKEWLIKNDMLHFFEEISNVKHPSRYYIDDKGIRFNKDDPDAWDETMKFILSRMEKHNNV